MYGKQLESPNNGPHRLLHNQGLARRLITCIRPRPKPNLGMLTIQTWLVAAEPQAAQKRSAELRCIAVSYTSPQVLKQAGPSSYVMRSIHHLQRLGLVGVHWWNPALIVAARLRPLMRTSSLCYEKPSKPCAAGLQHCCAQRPLLPMGSSTQQD